LILLIFGSNRDLPKITWDALIYAMLTIDASQTSPIT